MIRDRLVSRFFKFIPVRFEAELEKKKTAPISVCLWASMKTMSPFARPWGTRHVFIV